MKDVHELEVYACIEGYPDYLITSKGRVLSLKGEKIKEMKLQKDKCGYIRIKLFKNNKSKFILVHRLVAQAFIPNPDNKPQVNHIDENKTNNFISNLEWVTAKENCNHGTRTERIKENFPKHLWENKDHPFKGKHHTEISKIKMSKKLSDGRLKGNNNPNCKGKIIGINEKTGDIRIYNYMNESKKDGFNVGDVSRCLNGKLKTVKGYKWYYYDEYYKDTH